MSLAALDDLILREKALIAAIDADDVTAIEAETSAFREALLRVRTAGGWREVPGAASRADEALALADAARVRVNYLTDLTRRRMEKLARAAGRPEGNATYGRDGRVRF